MYSLHHPSGEHPSLDLYARPDLALADREALLLHLEECIPCMNQYLAALEEGRLEEPPPGMEERILQALREDARRRRRKILFVNTAKLAVAVCLTMVLSLGGVFNALGGRELLERQPPAGQELLAPSPWEGRPFSDGFLTDLKTGFRTFARAFNSFSVVRR